MKYVLSLAQELAQEPVNHILLHALLELMDSLDPWLLQSKLCAAVETFFLCRWILCVWSYVPLVLVGLAA